MSSSSFSDSNSEHVTTVDFHATLMELLKLFSNFPNAEHADSLQKQLREAASLDGIRTLSEGSVKISNHFFSKKVWDEDVPDFSTALETIMWQNKSLSSFVPPAALIFFSDAVLFSLDALTRYPGEKSWALWLTMPSMLLWSIRSTTELARARFVATRSYAFTKGQMGWLWETMTVQMVAYQKRGEGEKKKGGGEADYFDEKRFLFLCANNRAAEALELAMGIRGKRVAFVNGELDEATVNLINEKMPEKEKTPMPPGWQNYEAFCGDMRARKIKTMDMDEDDLKDLYSGMTGSKRRGTGGGLSGWSFDMMLNALRVPTRATALQKAYLGACQLLANGVVPNLIAKWLQASPLVIVETALGKRRVVFPQEVLFRDFGALAFKWALRQKGFREYFGNNYALGVKNGALIPSVVLRETLESNILNPQVGVVSRDVKNQFHEFDRLRLFECLLENHNVVDLRPLLYGAGFLTIPTPALIRGTDKVVELPTGSAQGWALSTIFAAMVMQPCLDEIAIRMGNKLMAFPCFADNVEGVMEAQHVKKYLEVSSSVLVELRSGYEFGPRSDSAYFPRLKPLEEQPDWPQFDPYDFDVDLNIDLREQIEQLFPQGNVSFGGGILTNTSKVDRGGTIITGVPVGDDAFETHQVKLAVDRAVQALHSVVSKNVNMAAVMKIIEECILSRLSFLCAGVSPSVTQPLMFGFDTELLKAFGEMLRWDLSALQEEQVQLPKRLGGFGLRPTGLACVPIYIVSQIKARNTVKCSFPSDLPQHILSYNTLVEKKNVITNTKAGLTRLVQRTMKDTTYAIYENNAKILERRLNVDDQYKTALARMPGSTTWMKTIPKLYENTGRWTPFLSNSEFRTNCLHRLISEGKSNFVPNNFKGEAFPVVACPRIVYSTGKACGRMIKANMVHACTCNKQDAHNALDTVVEMTARFVGFKTSRSVQLPGENKKADLLIFNLQDGIEATAIDFTVRHPHASGALKRGGDGKPNVWYHLNRAEKQKREKYTERYKRIGRGFEVFGVSATGALSAGAKKVIGLLASRFAEKMFIPDSVAVAQINILVIAATMRQIARNCGPAISKIAQILRRKAMNR